MSDEARLDVGVTAYERKGLIHSPSALNTPDAARSSTDSIGGTSRNEFVDVAAQIAAARHEITSVAHVQVLPGLDPADGINLQESR